MPDKTTPKVDWEAPLAVTARRGDIAAAAQALGYANNPTDEAMAFRKTLDAALHAPGQPPSLVLSDEQRARLIDIADELDCLVDSREDIIQSPLSKATFLRNLVSQEHRG